jgi:hypothetical protein
MPNWKGRLGAAARRLRLPGAAGAGGKLVDAEGHPQIGFMVRQLPTPLVLILEVSCLTESGRIIRSTGAIEVCN